MKIRRLQYNIDYVHILTFKDEYREAIAPYFGFDNVRYGIENENTINESIRLIFVSECLALNIRKEGITFIYEGNVDDLKIPNGILKIFWDIYERLTHFHGYKKSTRHSLVIDSVEIMKDSRIDKILNDNPYFKVNPFGGLVDFACVYEFVKEEAKYKFIFGNFSDKDIKKFDLLPFKTEYNSDMVGNRGIMCHFELNEPNSSLNQTKFKSLLNKAEQTISSYKIF